MRRILLAILACMAVPAQERDPSHERVVVDRGSGSTMKPLVHGARYAAASMAHQATQAADRMLAAGGNAFDAIVAGQAVLGLVAPASNGIGGDAVLLVYSAADKKAWSINAEGAAPKLATVDWYKQNHNGKLPVNDTLLSGTVPGVIDAWYILLSRWGTKSFAEVLAPAIDLAENGYPLSRRYARSFADRGLVKYPSSAELYRPGGKDWEEGEVFQNRQLAQTLRRLVEAEKATVGQGRQAALKAARDRFYKGDIARTMGEFSEKNGGLFRYEDFAAYSAEAEEPVSVDYRGYQVYKNPSASQGPAELFALNILEGYDLKGMGHNSADYIHVSAEAMKLAMADREKYLGDRKFIEIPYAGLLSKEYAAERRKLIDMRRASREFRAGEPERFMNIPPLHRPVEVNISGNADHEGGTSYITVVDQHRNAITFTPSLHSGFGTKLVIADLGFSINCRGDYYSLKEGHANQLGPGRRPRSTLQGTLVMKDGKPFLVTGSPGGDDQCMRTMQTLLNMVEFGMDVQQAIEAPRWSTRSFPASPFPHTMYPGDLQLEGRIAPEVRHALVERGHSVWVRGPWSMNQSAGIRVDPARNTLSAGADPRTGAQATAW
ncbi:MAG: gamma-glutamyltransferase [Acidimicrobiia bacterium]|nr:gamma-glutamyltransferase [Acidimicrobiia bacterium]